MKCSLDKEEKAVSQAEGSMGGSQNPGLLEAGLFHGSVLPTSPQPFSFHHSLGIDSKQGSRRCKLCTHTHTCMYTLTSTYLHKHSPPAPPPPLPSSLPPSLLPTHQQHTLTVLLPNQSEAPCFGRCLSVDTQDLFFSPPGSSEQILKEIISLASLSALMMASPLQQHGGSVGNPDSQKMGSESHSAQNHGAHSPSSSLK